MEYKTKKQLTRLRKQVAELKKSKAEYIQIEEQQYRTLIENLPQKVFLKDINSVYISCNENYARDLKIKPEEIAGKTDYDFFPTYLAEKYRADDERVIKSGKTENIEEEYLAIGDSQKTIVNTVKVPVRDKNGNVTGLFGLFWNITKRKRTEEELKKHREHLEELVIKRTNELKRINEELQQDITERKRIEEELRQSEKRYRELWDDAPVAYHTLDTKGIITNVNKTEAKMLGYKPQEMIGKPIFDFILPEQQAMAKKRVQEKLSGKHPLKTESRIYVRKDGSKIYVSIDDVLEYDSEGKVIGIRTTMVDITESKKMEEALRESELQYRTTINSIGDPITVVDADLRIILFNNAFKKWLQDIGLKIENATGQTLFDVLPFLSDKTRNEYIKVFESGETLVTEEHINIGEREFIAEVRKIPIWEDTKVVRILTITRDITERRKAEETIRHLAYYDVLTNLPNRPLFNNRLALELNRAQRNKQQASVMLLDLDKFKNVNDTLGHSLGDRLLQSVGRRLSDIVRSSDTVARMGGDEFILLLTEITDVKYATMIAEKILDTIRKPFVISDHKLYITTSIGISIYPTHGEDAETLIKNADIAMYKAKESGRDRYFLYGTNLSLPIPF